MNKNNVSKCFRPGVGALHFFASLLPWGIAVGCFQAVMTNYLVEIVGMDPVHRGTLEFFREMPGLLLVFILAVMHRFSEWKILKIGTLISLVGVVGLLANTAPVLSVVTLLIVLWSTGEHILMPIRSTIAMMIAVPGKVGRSLGLVSSVSNFGTVLGSLLVAAVFYFGVKVWPTLQRAGLYDVIWGLIAALLVCSLLCILRFRSKEGLTQRPRLYFHWKYRKFYALELFYGARKQIFFTFAPFILVKVYSLDTEKMALLMGLCALLNSFFSPLIGRLTDWIGYKNVMIYDTIILFFVCLVYGYADQLFSPGTATIVVCINYLADAVISTSSMATNMYVREISDSNEEVTASLTTGISINHLISIFAALAGGYIWEHFGFGVLFSFAAVMALCNSAFALTLPKPGSVARQRV